MTEAKRTDRRTNRTRRLLKEAMFALILEKGYDAVTIEDITERADLGRTTFYLHYHDKEELLLEAIDAIADDLMEQIAPIPYDNWDVPGPAPTEQNGALDAPPEPRRDPIRVVFQHAQENAHLYLIILRGEGATKAAGRVQAIISQKAAEVIKTLQTSGTFGLNPQVPVEVFANYFAGALLGLITWWLESTVPYTPNEMAEMFRKLFFQGGRKVIRGE